MNKITKELHISHKEMLNEWINCEYYELCDMSFKEWVEYELMNSKPKTLTDDENDKDFEEDEYLEWIMKLEDTFMRFKI